MTAAIALVSMTAGAAETHYSAEPDSVAVPGSALTAARDQGDLRAEGQHGQRLQPAALVPGHAFAPVARADACEPARLFARRMNPNHSHRHREIIE
jgi:hypothetical protein